MKKTAKIVLLILFFFSCDKGYDEEIFLPKYQIIYGEWRHIITKGGWRGDVMNTDDYIIKFVPIGIFYNRDGTKDIISVFQPDKPLIISLNFTLGTGRYKEILFFGNDTLMIRDCGTEWLTRLYVRSSR